MRIRSKNESFRAWEASFRVSGVGVAATLVSIVRFWLCGVVGLGGEDGGLPCLAGVGGLVCDGGGLGFGKGGGGGGGGCE